MQIFYEDLFPTPQRKNAVATKITKNFTLFRRIINVDYGARKAPYTLSVKLSDFTVWRHTWRKNWVNCAVLKGNSAGLRTVLSSRLSHRELRSSLMKSHSFLSLPADTRIASSQDTFVSSNSLSKWASRDIRLKYHVVLYILRFLFFFSDNITADVVSKQQTTALFYPP